MSVSIAAVHKIPTRLCQECGATMNAASAPDRVAPPGPGDVTMCLQCGTLFVWDKNWSLQKIQDEDLDADTLKDIRWLRRQWRDYKAHLEAAGLVKPQPRPV